MLRAILSIVPKRSLARAARRRVHVAVALVGVAVVAGAACGDGTAASSEGSVVVVASFYPLAYAAERVGGGAVTVTNLTPPGVEPHDLEVTSDDLEAIAGADVVVYLGGGFQPAIEEAVASEASGVIVDALEGVDTLPAPPGTGDGQVDGAPAEHDATDPHVWLDPMRFAEVVERVASALGEAHAADAGLFERNGRDLLADLSALDREFRRGLASCETRVMFTNHAAFGYLAAAYDLEQEAVSGLSPESEPDPARIAELADEARAVGATTIFTEDLLSAEVAETLAAEAGLETATLSPLEGLTAEQVAAGDDYLTLMRRNLETLRDGLGCA
jgi:zinc transport system substrate-binding protein